MQPQPASTTSASRRAAAGAGPSHGPAVSLLVRTLPLAAAAAVSPVLLITAVMLLARPDRPRLATLAFAAGNVTVLVALAVLVVAVLPTGHGDHGSTTAGDAVDLVLGVLLLTFGAGELVRWARRRFGDGPPPPDPAPDPSDHGGGLAGLVALGIVLMATNASTVALYLSILKDVAESTASAAVRTLDLTVVVVVVMAPVLVPLAVATLWPAGAARALGRVREVVVARRDIIVGVLFVGFGLYLTVRGGSAL